MARPRASTIAALAGLFVLSAASVRAGVYCYYTCSLYLQGECVEHRSGCTNTPSPGGGRTYGAIAYSPATQRYGYSDRYASQSAADSRAMAQCGQRDCVIATWFFNSCGALATAGNRIWGAAQSGSAGRAGVLAQSRCRQEGGADCRVVVSHCSG